MGKLSKPSSASPPWHSVPPQLWAAAAVAFGRERVPLQRRHWPPASPLPRTEARGWGAAQSTREMRACPLQLSSSGAAWGPTLRPSLGGRTWTNDGRGEEGPQGLEHPEWAGAYRRRCVHGCEACGFSSLEVKSRHPIRPSRPSGKTGGWPL